MQYQRDCERRIRVGMVGVGSHCYRNILPTLTFLPMELVAIADVERERGLRTARQYGVKVAYTSAAEMYEAESLDAVIIAVSGELHPMLSMDAFAHGLHVWLEKPPAIEIADIDDMIRARGDLIAVVGYKKVFMPATVKALELLAMESMTPLCTVSAVYPIGLPVAQDLAGNNGQKAEWMENACHPLSVLLALGGSAATTSVHRGPGGTGFLQVQHEGGAVSCLQLAAGGPAFQPIERYLAFGGSGSVEIFNSRKVRYQRGLPFDYSTGTSFVGPGVDSGAVVWEAQDGFNTLENKAVFTQGLYGSLRHFADCVLDKAPVERGGLEFAREVTAVSRAALGAGERPVCLGEE